MLVPGGRPNGMKVVDIPGWSGKCFVVPRQSLKELKERSDVGQPGLYLLFGKDESSGRGLVYIGESESFYSRIANHDSNKDFWDIALIFTGGLNRAFVKFLEYRATDLAHKVGRMDMLNKVQPQENTLSEFEKVTIEQYFENVQFILQALGYEVFESVEQSFVDTMLYYLNIDGTKATARVLDTGELLVLKGALARIAETESFGGWSKAARQAFLHEGKMVVSDQHPESYEFVQDILFASPSAAAATLSGRSINGWTAWKDKDGKTLDENLRA